MLNKDWGIGLRGEYYNDKSGVIIATGTPDGFKAFSASLNADKHFGELLLWRTEVRLLNSRDKIFMKNDGFTQSNTVFTTSISLSF
jgi:2-keto-4-pentenoate hydratase/2-oxohepta-3-ene-1,7-dioic acid hydratase in catechol pathway